jgi:hypothetical protein
MIQPLRTAHLLARLHLHCPVCDQTGEHRLLEPAAQPLPGRASLSCLLMCSGCGASQHLTRFQKKTALKYVAASRYAS